MTLAVHLMGPVRLVRNGEPIDVGGPKQQAVLAVLALSAGQRVSTDRLIDLVWDEDPPVSARRTVQSYVASLRRAQSVGEVLEPWQNGYVLRVDRGSVDLLSFEDRAADVLADVGLDPDAKADALADALASWETPLEGLRGMSRLQDLIAPFEELRFQAVEGLAESHVSGSGAGEAVRMLEPLVREHPTRENLWFELARGLDRLGRRDAALNAIQRAREALRDHLGVHPSALLIGLETDLLREDGTRLRHAVENRAGPSSDVHEPPAELAARPGNLPLRLSSFIGRADEIGEIAQFLLGTRLVTLRGLGGIGKTSLALRVAADCAPEFEDGVWFIDLAYVAPSAAMSERFVAALGLTAQDDLAPLDHLLAQLEPLRALLVVDNCEGQINDVAELVWNIVGVAPGVHVLATSRTSLAVDGEAVWQVGPLERSTAVELFAARARFVRHGFELNRANRRAVESICEKLDGIPLAIELAAARLNVLSLDQILEHLDDRFELLSDPDHGGGDDERTLQAALRWSYGLLAEPEQSLLRRLTVFPAGITLDAASGICVEDAGVVDLVNSLARLVEASLVVFEVKDDDPRYRLLETVREYAAELSSASERDEVARRHARYFVDLASRVAIDLETDHLGTLSVIDRNLDDFRAVMAWAFEHEEAEWGLSVARHLSMYFYARQLNREFLRWLQIGIGQVDPESDEGLLAVAHALVAADNSGNIEVVDQMAGRVENGIDLTRSPAVRARLLTSHAAHLIDVDPRAADTLLAEATELFKSIDRFAILSCIHNRLMISWRTGDLPHAEAMAADLDQLPDRPIVRRQRLILEIQAAACTGAWSRVIDLSIEHYGLDEETSLDLLHFRAEALGALERNDEAIATLDHIDGLERREDLARSNSQILRATTELRRGGAVTARSLLAESATLFGRDSDRVQRAWLASLAGVAAHQLDADETAALLFGHARVIGREFDVDVRMSERRLVEEARQECRATLGPERFDELAGVGAFSTWAELVELLRGA